MRVVKLVFGVLLIVLGVFTATHGAGVGGIILGGWLVSRALFGQS